MKICIGIPSYLPEKQPDRKIRQDSLNKLLLQLSELWPNIDILIIAQNWKDFSPIKISNKLVIKYYEPLGILKARKLLREHFLKLNYDYIIMFDDDITIKCDNSHAAKDFIKELERHPKGFCFPLGHNSKYHPYCAAQLNLCAVSRFIYEQEPMVDVDPQNDEGYEDSIFSCLLHHKWGEYEFNMPKTIHPIHLTSYKSKIPSTWAEGKVPFYQLATNTDIIQEYIMKHKEFPNDWKKLITGPRKEETSQNTFYLYF